MTGPVADAWTAYTPKLASTLAEGYGPAQLRADAVAGLTVAIVALPLSMAIAVASGVSPDRGLYAAIVGGFIVSALGGSRFQIGGPAGAFIVLVAATVAAHGIDGLLLTVFLSGLLLSLVGLLRLGGLVRLIPHAVTVGFTAGIAVVILASQLKDFFGLRLDRPEPGPLAPKVLALAGAWPSASLAATGLAAGVAAVILLLRRWRPRWPGMLIAVVGASVVAALLGAPVETIGSRFGAMPAGLPAPHLPAVSWSRVVEVLPSALAFTLLGGIESLLSAVVADGMTGRRHRSDIELVAQGVANMGSALFGGLSVTGTIARTATNIRAGARSPVAGLLHAAFLAAFMILAAPILRFVPIPALAGLLVVVAWNMAEKGAIADLLRDRRAVPVLATTFVLTTLVDLVSGIAAGCAVALAVRALTGRTKAPPDESDGAGVV